MNYKVTKEDLIGDIKDFPIEVVQRMVDIQIEQNSNNCIELLQNLASGGFTFGITKEGWEFWHDVIFNKNFDLFFEKYPKDEDAKTEEVKQEIDTHVFYRGNAERGKEIISELTKLGGINHYNISAQNIDYLYFILPKTKKMGSTWPGSILYNIIEDAYTEKFLPEVKIETIEIDGKKYNKKEILEKINELKEIN